MARYLRYQEHSLVRASFVSLHALDHTLPRPLCSFLWYLGTALPLPAVFSAHHEDPRQRECT